MVFIVGAGRDAGRRWFWPACRRAKKNCTGKAAQAQA